MFNKPFWGEPLVIQMNKIPKSAPGDGIGESPPALMRKLVNPSLGY